MHSLCLGPRARWWLTLLLAAVMVADHRVSLGDEGVDHLAPEPDVEQVQYLEEALTHEDPAQEARIQALVDQAVAARLAGIPRPKYIPATDLAPP